MKDDSRPGPSCRNRTGYHRVTILVAVCLLLCSALALPMDVTTSAFIQSNKGSWPNFIADLMSNSETFGHGVGVSMIVIAVLMLDERRRSNWATLCGGSLGAGLLATLGKLLVARTRPRSYELVSGSTWDTFGSFIPGNIGSMNQSFPSGHTATAVGLATILAEWYPRGRFYFFTLAAFVGSQRMYCLAHYPSDVFAGAAAGWLIARTCLFMTEPQVNARGLPAAD